MVRIPVAKQIVTLAHVITDAGLAVTMGVGGVPSVGESAASDHTAVDPCAMRMVLLNLRSRCDRLDDVVSLKLTGAVSDTGGGLHIQHTAEGDRWWFATALAPRQVLDVLEAYETSPEGDGVNARLCVDSELQTTAISIFATSPEFTDQAERAARWCFTQCIVDEVIRPTNTAWAFALTDSNTGPQRSASPLPTVDQP